MSFRIERLNEANFRDFESLTSCQKDGGCYCAFWHQKWGSMKEWEERQAKEPLKNREVMRVRMDSGFHVGVLAYSGEDLVAWVSVSPLPECYWAWRRTAALGDEARLVAGITCITVSGKYRGRGIQKEILRALKDYGRSQGWSAIEGYPFDDSAYAVHGRDLAWAGTPKGYSEAGFERVGAHWMSGVGYERSIFRVAL